MLDFPHGKRSVRSLSGQTEDVEREDPITNGYG